jgi:hypothetical protein
MTLSFYMFGFICLDTYFILFFYKYLFNDMKEIVKSYTVSWYDSFWVFSATVPILKATYISICSVEGFFYRKAYQFINEEFALKKPNDLWYAEENTIQRRD